jgi:DNA-binding response OmpR family regulator
MLIERVLKRLGVGTIYHARSGEEAHSRALRSHPQLVIIEAGLAHMDGLELNDRLARSYKPCTLILYDSIDELSENHATACACVEKPVAEPDLSAVVRKAYERYREKSRGPCAGPGKRGTTPCADRRIRA